MKTLLALLRKEILVELRAKETLAVIASLALLLGVVCSFGIWSCFFDPTQTQKIFPVLVWIIFIFSATVSLERLYEAELGNHALEGLLLSGASPALIFAAKFTAAFILSALSQIVGTTTLALMLNVPVTNELAGFTLVSALVLIAYCSLAVLLAAMTCTSRLRGIMLPLILLPLLFPVFFAALELSSGLFVEHTLATDSWWFSLLVGVDLVYFVLGLNLFEYAVKE